MNRSQGLFLTSRRARRKRRSVMAWTRSSTWASPCSRKLGMSKMYSPTSSWTSVARLAGHVYCVAEGGVRKQDTRHPSTGLTG
jgi:hypothetical protein